MSRFRCKKCGQVVSAEFEACCAHPHGCKEKPPECRGQPMIKIPDE